jgi:hypothetical protein
LCHSLERLQLLGYEVELKQPPEDQALRPYYMSQPQGRRQSELISLPLATAEGFRGANLLDLAASLARYIR